MDQIHGVDFKYDPNAKGRSDEKHLAIEILSGDFTGVIYEYGVISCDKEDSEGNAILSFDYNILSKHKVEDLKDNLQFQNKLGDILLSIIKTSLEDIDENRTDDIAGTVSE